MDTSRTLSELPATIEGLESRRLLSVGPDPTFYAFGSNDIDATAASADGRTGHLLLAGSIAHTANVDPVGGSKAFTIVPFGTDYSSILVQYSPTGKALWVNVYNVANTLAAGSPFGVISAVAAGPDGSVYAAGTFSGSLNFDVSQNTGLHGSRDHTLTTIAAEDGEADHGVDAFIVKYDASGKYLWGKLLSNVTTGLETVSALTIDRFGSAYLVGTFTPIFNAVTGTKRSFLTKFASNGDRSWVISLSGVANTVALDHYDTPWVATGGDTLRLYKFNPRGRFVSRIGAAALDRTHGAGSISASSIAFDGHDNIVLSGQFSHTFDFAPGKDQMLLGDKHYNRMGWSNIFLSKIRPTGELVFAQAVGGIEGDNAAGAGIDRATGDIILTGTYSGKVDFDPAHHAATIRDAGYDSVDGDYPSDIFVARYSPTGRFMFVKDHTTTDYDRLAGFGITPTLAFMAASNYDQKQDHKQIEMLLLPLA